MKKLFIKEKHYTANKYKFKPKTKLDLPWIQSETIILDQSSYIGKRCSFSFFNWMIVNLTFVRKVGMTRLGKITVLSNDEISAGTSGIST